MAKDSMKQQSRSERLLEAYKLLTIDAPAERRVFDPTAVSRAYEKSPQEGETLVCDLVVNAFKHGEEEGRLDTVELVLGDTLGLFMRVPVPQLRNRLTPAHRQEIAGWLSDRIGELEPDEESIAEERGEWFLPALRDLVRELEEAKGAPKA